MNRFLGISSTVVWTLAWVAFGTGFNVAIFHSDNAKIVAFATTSLLVNLPPPLCGLYFLWTSEPNHLLRQLKSIKLYTTTGLFLLLVNLICIVLFANNSNILSPLIISSWCLLLLDVIVTVHVTYLGLILNRRRAYVEI